MYYVASLSAVTNRLPFIRSSGCAIASLLSATAALAQPVVSEEYAFDMSWSSLDQSDLFGNAVALENDYIVIGASSTNYLNDDVGLVFVFETSTGDYYDRITPAVSVDDLAFGTSVAAESGIAAIGAPGQGSGVGEVVIVDIATGALLHTLHASDPAARQFGVSLALDGGVLAVGATRTGTVGNPAYGAVYLFDVSSGAELKKVVSADATASDLFGSAVALQNGILAVGSRFDDDNGQNSGSVYLFDVASGSQIARLLPGDGSAGDNFGQSVAIASDTVLIGAPNDDDMGPNSGAAYLFDATTGAELDKIVPSTISAGDRFGYSVTAGSDVLAISAIDSDDRGADSGSVFVYDRVSVFQISKLLPSDGEEFDRFGTSVAINGETVVVGGVGVAYIYAASPPSQCDLADVNRNGAVNAADFSSWVAAFNSATPRCDQNADGLCTPADFSAWIANFIACAP